MAVARPVKIALSWFMAKNTEPTANAMQSVRFRCWGAPTTDAASRHVDQVAVRSLMRETYASGPDATSVLILNLSGNPEFGRPADQLGLRAYTKLGVDAHQVRLHGAFAHDELIGDRLRRLAMRREERDLAFTAA